MQKYINSVANAGVDAGGSPIRGASVLVLNYPSGTTATIYSDNNLTPQSNPIATDSNGAFAFYAADGRYSLQISGSGISTQNLYDILLEDPTDGGSPGSFTTLTVGTSGTIGGSAIQTAASLGAPGTAAIIGSSAGTVQTDIDARPTSSTLAASGGAALVGFSQSPAAAAGTTAAKLQQIVSVKDAPYNAKGDGTTDDTTAIQAAFTAIKAKGGILYFPIGTYLISGTVGTSNASSTDFCDNVTVSGYGATILATASASLTALNLEGNNCHVEGLKFNSLRTINFGQDPTPQRTPYQSAIVIGGKLATPRSIGNATYLRSNVSVKDCEIANFNAPITVGRATFASVVNNYVHDFTDTGVLIDDCITDVLIRGNTVVNGGDDCIFARHYGNSFYVNGNSNYVGRLLATGNTLGFTFAKCFGVGGFSDILLDGNSLFDCWAGSIDYENGGNWTSRSIDNQNFVVSNNTIRGSGTLYGPSYWRTTAFPDTGTQSAFHGQYQSTRTPYPWTNLVFCHNKVIAPLSYGVCIKSANLVSIHGNVFIAQTPTPVAAVKLYSTVDADVADNWVIGNGVNFPYCYELSATAGEAILQRINIKKNTENFGTKVMNITSSEYSAINYVNDAPAGYNGTIESVGYDNTLNRFSFVGSGANSNLQVYHATSWPLRVFNSGGDMLLQVNDSGTATGNLGVGVGGTPSRRLHVTGPGGGAPALRLDNSNVNNGAVAVTLGSVGPTGSTAGNPQGWLAIDVGGATHYVPFW